MLLNNVILSLLLPLSLSAQQINQFDLEKRHMVRLKVETPDFRRQRNRFRKPEDNIVRIQLEFQNENENESTTSSTSKTSSLLSPTSTSTTSSSTPISPSSTSTTSTSTTTSSSTP